MNVESLEFLERIGGIAAHFDKIADKSIGIAVAQGAKAVDAIVNTQNQFLAQVDEAAERELEPNPNFRQIELDQRHVEKLRAEQEKYQNEFQHHFEGYKREREQTAKLSSVMDKLTEAIHKLEGQLDSAPIQVATLMAEKK